MQKQVNSLKHSYGKSWAQRIYPPRIAGYLLGFIPISVIFYQHGVGISYWIYSIPCTFVWPHLAYYISIRSTNTKKAEFRNLSFDAFFMGISLPLISFNFLPSIILVGMSLLTSISGGGVKFLLRGILFFILGILISIYFVGVHINQDINTLIIVACTPILILYPMAIAFATYGLAKQYNKARKSIESQKEQLEDSYAETQKALRETRAKEQEIANINQVVQAVNSTLEIDAVLEAVANALQHVFSFNQVGIMLIDEQKKELVFEKPYGEGLTVEQIEKCKKIKFSLKKEVSICCAAALKNKSFYVPYITSEMLALFLPTDRGMYEVTHCKSYLFCPLEFQKKVIGVIVFGDNRQPFKLTENDLEKIQRYVNQIATAINNARLVEELKAAKQIAETATKSKSDFLSTMSHEIRTPMNAILGMSDLLSEASLPDEQKSFVKTISASGTLLLSVINDILDFSKIEAGQIELEKTVFDVNDLGDTSCKMLSLNAQEKNLDLACRIASDIKPFRIGDPTRLRQIIINLLSNAIKFTHQGEVVLEVVNSNDPGLLEFCVQDTGIGIPQDKQQSVFDSFTQADTSTTRKFGGTGLGLAICKRLVELMGGRIWIESEEGNGTRFYFTARFPETDQIPESSATTARDLKLGLKHEEIILPPLRILLAEDVENNWKLIKLYLKDFPVSIDVAENGAIAVEKYCNNHYDLVLMDSEMPEMDGLNATRVIRKWEKENDRSETPVIALTAHAFQEHQQKCMDAGCNGYLTKPIKKKVLLEQIFQFTSPGPLPDQHVKKTDPKTIDDPESSDDRCIVKIEAEIKELIPDFMAQTINDLDVMQKALTNRDSETLRRIGHSLKGSAFMYEFNRLGNMGEVVEDAAMIEDFKQIEDILKELKQYLDCIQIEYV